MARYRAVIGHSRGLGAFAGRSAPAAQVLNQPPGHVGVAARGLQLEEALEGSQRRRSVALLTVALGEAEDGAGVAAVLIERPFEGADRLLRLAPVEPGVGEPDERIDSVGLLGERLLEQRLGSSSVSLVEETLALGDERRVRGRRSGLRRRRHGRIGKVSLCSSGRGRGCGDRRRRWRLENRGDRDDRRRRWRLENRGGSDDRLRGWRGRWRRHWRGRRRFEGPGDLGDIGQRPGNRRELVGASAARQAVARDELLEGRLTLDDAQLTVTQVDNPQSIIARVDTRVFVRALAELMKTTGLHVADNPLKQAAASDAKARELTRRAAPRHPSPSPKGSAELPDPGRRRRTGGAPAR